jgi:hypothetical protein
MIESEVIDYRGHEIEIHSYEADGGLWRPALAYARRPRHFKALDARLAWLP